MHTTKVYFSFKIALFSLLLFCPLFAISQNVLDVRGIVKDSTGSLVVGATISNMTTKAGAFTDANGAFNIKATKGDRLQVSSIGYNMQTVTVESNLIEIVLGLSVSTVDEIVVVGYGTQRKASVTGSVAQIKGSELVKSPVANLTNSVIGRLPGLRATQRSGQPGSDDSGLDIRGLGNMLIIVDGIPGSFAQLDPNEIETFSIIKDASAAVFGVRAANGVVLVTTRRGKNGKTTINYSNYFGTQTINRFPELGDASLFAELSNEAAMNAWVIGGRTSAAPSMPFSQETISKYKSGELTSYNWFDKAIRRSAAQSYHNLNVSGGTDNTKFFLNFGTVNQDGMWRSNATNFRRYNIRANVEAKVANGLTAEMNIAGRIEERSEPSTSTSMLMAGLYRTYPTYPFYANGNPDYPTTHNNPSQNTLVLMDPSLSGYSIGDKKIFNGIFSLKYDVPFLKGMWAKATYSYNTEIGNRKAYNLKYSLYGYDSASDSYYENFVGNTPSNLSVTNNNEVVKTFQGSLNYSKKFNNAHDVSAMALMESRDGYDAYLYAYRQYLLDGVDELFAGVGQNQNNDGSSGESARIGYVGRLNYGFKDKYLAEFAFRYDGTFKVMSGSRWGFFPTMSLGWNISKENFLKDVKAIDDIKFRFSYGKVGDDENIAAFQYLMGYTYPVGNWIFGNNPIPGLQDRGIPNTALTWYTAKTANFGLDFSLFNGLIGGELDIFHRTRDGLLANRLLSLPNTFGASLPQENLNTDSHRGFELALHHKNKIGSFKYSVSPNVSWTRRRNGYIERAESTNSYHNWMNNYTNRWSNLYWGYEAIGQFQNQEEINSAPVHDSQANQTLLPGDIRYKDINGDGVINDNDVTVIGRGTVPETFFGLNLTGEYKGIDMSILLQGATNFNAYFSEELQNPLFNNASAYEMFSDRWHREDAFNPDSKWIPGKYPSTIVSGSNNNKRVSSFWLKDASYLRVKNIEVGYNFDKTLLQRIGVGSFRIYASGQNVLTFDKIKFIDPEAPSGRGGYYPQQRVWTLGLNIGF